MHARDMTVQKKGSGYVLRSRKTGKVLGTHRSRKGAARQERAIQAAKRARAPKRG